MPPEGKEIEADSIDEAAGQILGYLEDTSKGNVIYFAGWNGLGASAVLKLVARLLQPSTTKVTADLNPRLKFDRIIHVDCSVWKSRRALQKAIAQELDLPCSVMAIFGQRDEEDDLNAVDEASRAEIADVASEIYKKVQGRRILVILHNGSCDCVDLNYCGIPVYGYLRNKVLWTWHGRFRFGVFLQATHGGAEKRDIEKMVEQMGVFLQATHADGGSSSHDKWWDLVREEAEEVARYTGIPEPVMEHQMVEDCILYMWALRDVDSIDWGAHASNYWVCDGIIQQGGGGTDRSAWEIGDALHRNMHLDWEGDDWKIISGAIRYYQWRPNDRWISATPQYLQQHDHVQQSSSGLPPEATSFFLAIDKAAEPSINTVLSADLFQHPDSMLRVIQLSRCTFSFASPPFLSCRNLRFLLLDHCKDGHSDTDVVKGSADGGVIEHSHNGSWRACFQKLWVLDLSYTDWYWLLSEEMINLMAELRELNVKGVKHWSLSHLHGGTRSRTWLLNLVKLRVTAEPTDDITQAPSSMVEFPNLSSAIGLKEVILNGCVGLEQVKPDALPPSLESFTFSVDIPTKAKGVGEGGGPKDASTSAKVHSISFMGCAQLKISLLRGLLGRLEELDMSGTAVKTLDLSAMQAPYLKRLFLLGCEKLRAILWPPEGKRPQMLDVLHIDTTRSLSAGAARRPLVPHYKWHVSVRDARLLQSLVPTSSPGLLRPRAPPAHTRYINKKETHIEISSPTSVVSAGGSKAQGIRRSSSSNNTTNNSLNATSGSGFSEKQVLLSRQQPDNLYAHVIAFKDHLQPAAANGGHAPEIPPYDPENDICYMHIQDQMKTELQRGSEGTTITLPEFVGDCAAILHVHDSLSITSITAPAVGSRWYNLKLCRIERCPGLQGSVFTAPQAQASGKTIFYHLTTFRASQLLKARYIWNWSTVFEPGAFSFEDLKSLYLDQCPRLIHILPLSTSMTTFRRLETLEIVWCGDLRKVFRLDTERQEQLSAIEFPRLKHIHLHELPILQHICGRRMSAPKLEKVKIRGCWSLKRLPAVRKEEASPRPTVDCEKEWWDGLEWDGLPAGHHPSLYEPRHSAYYKKKLPRGSLLR